MVESGILIITKFKKNTKEVVSIAKSLGLSPWMFVMPEKKVSLQAIWIGWIEKLWG